MADKIYPLTIPKWGLTMVEGTLTRWLVAEGDRVAEGDVIADIETSKIVNELEASTAGILRRRLVSENDILPVGALIGVMTEGNISEDAIGVFIEGFVPEGGETQMSTPSSEMASDDRPAPRREAPASKEWVIPALLKGANAAANKAVLTTPQTLKIATNFDVDLTKITGTGRRGRICKADLVAAIENGGGSSGGKATIRKLSPRDLRATPLAIRMAGLLNVDISTVSPTGYRGRIRRADVEAAANLIRSPESTSVVKSAPLVARSDEAYEDKPLTAIRKVIAARLSQSKSTAPHFRVTMEIELDSIVLLRQSINKGRKGQKVSLNDIFVKAAALSLVASPDVNIQFDGTNIRRFKDTHVSVAVALPDGLMTPVVRHANRKSLLEISTEIAEFGRKAKDGALLPDDFEGGSFTVSNMGMFGVEQFDAIINPPQGAILALGAGHLQKRLGAGGKDYTALVMKATLSADHRVIDGAVAARFMQVLKATIENPKTEIS